MSYEEWREGNPGSALDGRLSCGQGDRAAGMCAGGRRPSSPCRHLDPYVGPPNRCHVSDSKSGLDRPDARQLAVEIAPHMITCNALSPGAIDTGARKAAAVGPAPVRSIGRSPKRSGTGRAIAAWCACCRAEGHLHHLPGTIRMGPRVLTEQSGDGRLMLARPILGPALLLRSPCRGGGSRRRQRTTGPAQATDDDDGANTPPELALAGPGRRTGPMAASNGRNIEEASSTRKQVRRSGATRHRPSHGGDGQAAARTMVEAAIKASDGQRVEQPSANHRRLQACHKSANLAGDRHQGWTDISAFPPGTFARRSPKENEGSGMMPFILV